MWEHGLFQKSLNVFLWVFGNVCYCRELFWELNLVSGFTFKNPANWFGYEITSFWLKGNGLEMSKRRTKNHKSDLFLTHDEKRMNHVKISEVSFDALILKLKLFNSRLYYFILIFYFCLDGKSGDKLKMLKSKTYFLYQHCYRDRLQHSCSLLL